jgi:hypothetical protein
MNKMKQIALASLALLVSHSALFAGASSAYNSYSYRQITREAHNYAPSGAMGRTHSSTHTIRERQYFRFQSGFDQRPTGSTKIFEFGWITPRWTNNPGPIVTANNSTRIHWESPNSWMLEFSKSDDQRSSYSCDAVFDGPEYYYNPPGEAEWVRSVNPAFNWEREIYINVEWQGVVGGLEILDPIEALGIPSFLYGHTGIDRTSRSGRVAGYRMNGYVSIGSPEGATAIGHLTGAIDLH